MFQCRLVKGMNKKLTAENRKVYRREPQRNAIFLALQLFACPQRTVRQVHCIALCLDPLHPHSLAKRH